MSLRRVLRPSREALQTPVELRFIDLFMIIVAALLFVVLSLSLRPASPREPGRTPLVVATRSMPSAVEDMGYDLYLAARGGSSPYRWRIAAGSLPAGMSLQPDRGLITGVPLAAGASALKVAVTDVRGAEAVRELALTVLPTAHGDRLRVQGPVLNLPAAVTFVPYRFRFRAEGGQPPYTWRLAEGELPPGLTLTPTGEVRGELKMDSLNPRLLEPWRLAMRVEDQGGRSWTQRAAMPLRYEPRRGPVRRFLRAVGQAIWRALVWIWNWGLAPLLSLSLAIAVLFTLLGFKGARARPWRGVFRRRRRGSRGWEVA